MCTLLNSIYPIMNVKNLKRLDMTDRPNVLFFDFAAELAENFDTEVTGSVYSVEICVKECPTGIVSHDDLYKDRDQHSTLICSVY